MGLINFDRTVPYIRKKGIAGFFQIIFHNFFDLVLLNFIFLITCLPVFTFGASYKALITVCNKYAEDKVVYPLREYFKNFKAEFLKSTLYGILFAVAFVIIGFSTLFYLNLSKNNIIFFMFAVLGAICFMLISMIFGWFFPIFTKIEQRFKELVINSFILTFKHIKSSLCFLLTIFLCSALIFSFFPFSVPFIAIFPFILISLASSCGAAEIVNKEFGIEQSEESEE